MRDKAVEFAIQLGIEHSKVTLNIFRLPHPDRRQGFLDYPKKHELTCTWRCSLSSMKKGT